MICHSCERGAKDCKNGVEHGGCGVGIMYTPDFEGAVENDLDMWYNTCRMLP